MRWQLVARELEAENKALRELVHAVPMGQSSYISSRIISDSSGPYSRSALISAGTNEGVRADQPVVSNAGLVGRVVDAGNRNARVLLLTDVSSRIPVVAEDSRERSILAGNNTNLPNLLYLPDNSNLQVGERIITSSDGGAFPAGIPVGVVESISGNEVKIRPLVDWFRLEYVSVIDFSL
jgi:rod shape-determining protein MreC